MNFQDGIDCGGAYIKLLSDTDDLTLVGTHVVLCLTPFIMCKVLICTVKWQQQHVYAI